MTITINGISISGEAIEAEAAAHHQGADDPERAAACALAVRELLLQRASTASIARTDGVDDAECDAIIERLLEREAPVPQPTEAECQ